MKIDLFSTSIWIGNIDSSKVKLIKQEVKPTFGSEVNTTYNDGIGSNIDEESVNYLYEVIVSLINETITNPYSLQLTNIWENEYREGDFQEKHIHPSSHLSFVIYKKVKESNTVFVNPVDKIIQAFYDPCKRKRNLFGPIEYSPECRENQIIVFPSYLEHYVKKTSNAITVSGNLNLIFNT
jgi:hypothetical protein